MKRRRDPESGFALLFVFVMAAAIAITLYIEVPRVAFESQRAREQMTIDRALQYQRGIQLFYRKFQLYPQNLDDLETTRNIRFLRHRYKDPLTGKEFRLLHVGPSGQLTDSLIQPAMPGGGGGNGGPGSGQNSTQAANNQPVDPNAPAPSDPLNMAARRPSDRIAPTGGGTPVEQQPDPEPEPEPPQQPEQPPLDPNQPAQPGQVPGQLPGQTGLPGQQGFPGQQGLPGQGAGFGGQQPVQDPNQQQNPQQPQFPLQPQFPGQQPQFPGQQPQFPGQQPQFPGQQPQFPAQQPQFPGQPQFPPQQPVFPGQTPLPGQSTPFPQLNTQQAAGRMPGAPGSGGAQANTAAGLIQSLLTTPRQPPASIAAFTTGNTGGIAGVASTAEGKSIHVVNDRTKYKEWEFVYDIKKDKNVVGAAGVAQQQQVQQQMQQSQQPGGNSAFGNSPFNSGAAPAAPTTPPPAQ